MLESYQITELLTTLMIAGAMVLLAYSPLPRSVGQALAHRLMHGRSPREGAGADPRVEAMADELMTLRRQLEETLERLEFAERMLAQGRERGLVGGEREGLR
jgi:hypothetical protein